LKLSHFWMPIWLYPFSELASSITWFSVRHGLAIHCAIYDKLRKTLRSCTPDDSGFLALMRFSLAGSSVMRDPPDARLLRWLTPVRLVPRLALGIPF